MQSATCSVDPAPHFVQAAQEPPAVATNVLCSSQAVHVRSTALPLKLSKPFEHWHWRFAVVVLSTLVSAPAPHLAACAHVAPPVENVFFASHATHLFFHAPPTLSQALPTWVSANPSLHWQFLAPFLAAFAGQGLLAPSTQAVASLPLEYCITPHTSHVPAAVAEWPVRPLPAAHWVWLPHALTSLAALNVAPPQVWHVRSDELLPVLAFRPFPGAHFFHGWHRPPLLENFAAGHALQDLVDVPLRV